MQIYGEAFPVVFPCGCHFTDSATSSFSRSVSVLIVISSICMTDWIDTRGQPPHSCCSKLGGTQLSSGRELEVLLVSMSASVPTSGLNTLHSKAPAVDYTIVGKWKSMTSTAVELTISANITLIWVSIANDTSMISSPSAGPPWLIVVVLNFLTTGWAPRTHKV